MPLIWNKIKQNNNKREKRQQIPQGVVEKYLKKDLEESSEKPVGGNEEVWGSTREKPWNP